MSSQKMMFTEPKSNEFITTVAFFLRNAFALVPSPEFRNADPTDAAFAPFVASLKRTSSAGIEDAESHCAALLQDEIMTYTKFWSEDSGDIAQIKETVPRCSLGFFGTEVSNISLHQYLHYVLPRMHCSEEAILMAVVYIARVVNKGVLFTRRSAHRMMAAALVVALKTHDERQYPMSYYAKITGIPLARLITSEAAMLDLLGYATFVSPVEHLLILFALRSCHAQTNESMFGKWEKLSSNLWFLGKQMKTTTSSSSIKSKEQHPATTTSSNSSSQLALTKSVKDLKRFSSMRRYGRSGSLSSFGTEDDTMTTRTDRTVPLSSTPRSVEDSCCSPPSGMDHELPSARAHAVKH